MVDQLRVHLLNWQYKGLAGCGSCTLCSLKVHSSQAVEGASRGHHMGPCYPRLPLPTVLF